MCMDAWRMEALNVAHSPQVPLSVPEGSPKAPSGGRLVRAKELVPALAMLSPSPPRRRVGNAGFSWQAGSVTSRAPVRPGKDECGAPQLPGDVGATADVTQNSDISWAVSSTRSSRCLSSCSHISNVMQGHDKEDVDSPGSPALMFL